MIELSSFRPHNEGPTMSVMEAARARKAQECCMNKWRVCLCEMRNCIENGMVCVLVLFEIGESCGDCNGLDRHLIARVDNENDKY